MSNKLRPVLWLMSLTWLVHFTGFSNSKTDTLMQGDNLTFRDSLFSSSGGVKLSFFQPYGNNTFLGINTADDAYYFWIANRDNPINGDSGLLTIDNQGNLKILSNNGTHVIMLYSVETPTNTSAVLGENGNFILQEINSDGSVKKRLWQSFDYPADTLLWRMKIGINWKTGHNWSLTSWRSSTVPASGPFTLGMDPNKTNHLVLWWRGNLLWTSGEWKNGTFSNLHGPSEIFDFSFGYVSNENETYFQYNSSVVNYINIGNKGVIGTTSGRYSCALFNLPFNSGCAPPSAPECRKTDVIYQPSSNQTGKMSREGFKFDERENLNIADCWMKCLYDCSCFAFTNANEDGTGCEIWKKSATLEFIATNVSGGRVFYFLEGKSRSSRTKLISTAVGITFVFIVLCSICYGLWRYHKEKGYKIEMLLGELGSSERSSTSTKKSSGDTSIFSFQSIMTATGNFSSSNKLGEGGFGPVYKGTLTDGKEIAIKCLSRNSGQGLSEFKNEVRLIAKLQHTNLIKLLGFCIEREQRMLMYEYMPNKSLDCYIFDSMRRHVLDWKKRFAIIEGIAQGLVYLHKYSRVRVIHRDLKASNVLLDSDMYPKISDFGMARILGLKNSEENASRVVGTYGYISPEYAMNGVVSTKTDVFSFGVLVLEIVSGKRNTGCYQFDGPLNLIGYAWKLWNSSRASELIDASVNDDSCNCSEALKCIHIGLLCVQDKSTERPTMLDVVSFLSHETVQLPKPKQPMFVIDSAEEENEQSCKQQESPSNDVTISEIKGR